MDKNKSKNGVSIKEIETFTKNHRFEVFFCGTFVLACIFSFIMWGTAWAVIAAGAGAILSVLLPEKVGLFSKKVWQFVLKQEPTTQIVLAVVTFILAIVIPPLIFFWIGLHSGKDLRQGTSGHPLNK